MHHLAYRVLIGATKRGLHSQKTSTKDSQPTTVTQTAHHHPLSSMKPALISNLALIAPDCLANTHQQRPRAPSFPHDQGQCLKYGPIPTYFKAHAQAALVTVINCLAMALSRPCWPWWGCKAR